MGDAEENVGLDISPMTINDLPRAEYRQALEACNALTKSGKYRRRVATSKI